MNLNYNDVENKEKVPDADDKDERNISGNDGS